MEDAKRARDLYHRIGAPTIENFKHIIRQKIIKNCPITLDDINRAEHIFGKDIGTLKGKSTRPKNPIVKKDLVEVPPEILQQHCDLVLCIDVFNCCGIPMFTAIDRSIRYRSLVPLKSRTSPELYRGLDIILRKYNKAGFTIITIMCDREFKPLFDEVSDELNVEMNYTSASEHVPEAERNNRTIGKRIRAAYHTLPYSNLPSTMVKYLAMICTQQLNYFPVKGGVSKYYSPYVIMNGKDLDYNKHCAYDFGSYVQAYNETTPKNSNLPRTLDAIYLRSLSNEQGGHELYDLNSNRVITRTTVTVIPVTQVIIDTINSIGKSHGITSLKFSNRKKIPFSPPIGLQEWIIIKIYIIVLIILMMRMMKMMKILIV